MNGLLSLTRKLGLIFVFVVSITILTACTTPIYKIDFNVDGEEYLELDVIEVEEGHTLVDGI